ncbi:MAG: hypothetical protein MRY59_05395 [Aquisalinus sp.]|nr:hypothetical protein [Aquisalinus sp.]
MKTIMSIVIIVLLSFIVHEAAHFAMALALGYEATATINHVRTVGPVEPGHALLIAAAGPALTYAQGIIGFLMARSGASMIGLHLVMVAAFQRVFAAIVSVNNPNDEMRISLDLGLGQWTLPAIIAGSLLVLMILSARTVKPGWIYILYAWLGLSIGFSLVVFGEPYLPAIRL